jgi:hypothetical protein
MQYPPAVLRLHPDAIPDVRAAIDATLAELTPHLHRMKDGAMLPGPWLGDSASHSVYVAYNEGVMGASDGAFQAICAYERQLRDIRNRLVEIEQGYARTETINEALMGGTPL